VFIKLPPSFVETMTKSPSDNPRHFRPPPPLTCRSVAVCPPILRPDLVLTIASRHCLLPFVFLSSVVPHRRSLFISAFFPGCNPPPQETRPTTSLRLSQISLGDQEFFPPLPIRFYIFFSWLLIHCYLILPPEEKNFSCDLVPMGPPLRGRT